MTKIPTLYSDYRECMLDLDIYGKIVATPQQSIQELTETLFEEFQRRKPMPTLEYKRYELSRLVNPDFRIAYNKELELQDNERLLDLQSNLEASFESIDFEDLTSLIPTTKELFSYENHVTDNMRSDIIEKYDLSTGETFKPGINQTENIVGSTSEDDSLTLTEEKIAQLGVDESEADVTMAEDPMEVVSFKGDDEDVKYEVDDDELEDYDSSESDSENDSESDLEEEPEVISEEDDSEDFDYAYEDDEASDYDDYDSEEDEETTEDIVDEDYGDYDSEDEASEEELDDDYSSDEDDSDEEDYSSDSEDESDDEDYDSGYEEESDEEDYSSDSEDDLDEEDYDDYDSDFEETSDDDYEDYDSDSDDENYSKPAEEIEDTGSSESEEKIKKVKGVAEESIDLDSDNFDVSSFIDSVQDEQVTKQFEPIVNKVVKTPITPLEARVNNPPQSEIIDRSAEPTEIRAFLRKHPRCEYDFALKYFTKKQINDAIKIGKIIKKGNILKI